MRNYFALLSILLILSCAVFAQEGPTDKEALDKANKELELNFKDKKYDQALVPAQELLKLSIKVYGAEHEETAIAYANLGAVLRELKKYDEAVENYAKAGAIYRKNEAKNGDRLANTTANMADTLRSAGKFSEAEAAYKSALGTAEKYFGNEDKKLLPFLYSLINFYAGRGLRINNVSDSLESGDVATVMRLIERCQQIAAKFYSPGSPERKNIADQFFQFGLQNLEEREFQEAFAKFQGIPGFEMEKVQGKFAIKGLLNGKARKLPQPAYPRTARAIGAAGQVGVKVLVDETGTVVSARAVSGHPLLRGSAVQAARGAIFEPASLNNKPIMVIGMIIYRFREGRN